MAEEQSDCPSSPLSSLSSTDDHHHHLQLTTPLRFFPVSRAELSLPAVLKCGQTFRWNRTSAILPNGHPTEVHLRIKSMADGQQVELVEWSLACFDRTVVLRQDDRGIHYTALYRSSDIEEYKMDCKMDTTYNLLRAYFVLDVSLVGLYQDWSRRDSVFSSKVASGEWDGLRVVRQDSWETMVSFICSANNNIPRISLMVNKLCATFGNLMPRPPLGITLPNEQERQSVQASHPSLATKDMYSFPSAKRLSEGDVADKLKHLGFGYRANYVHKSSLKLCEIAQEARHLKHWPGFMEDSADNGKKDEEEVTATDSMSENRCRFEPEDFLAFLASQPYEVAHSKLVHQFPGVGPKVADCICLFGLGFVHVVPVDIHIYKIAIRDYQLDLPSPNAKKSASRPATNKKKQAIITTKTNPESSSSKPSIFRTPPNTSHNHNSSINPPSLSRSNYQKIQHFFLRTWGPWAGWAQQILFLADLAKAPA
ncbi:hypothetical protein VP01_4155g1 [Puccinia sorghi]|uniref:DNA-(apurinic or apyrimidinic site) lyase n=1 Tax=Puccinia sorghi TaxID=27349 RepID=A0A0L6UQZ7_9BASI|nr:hypothetical protein VP01_4155g1 [Puccinia sorghi]